MTDHRSPPAAPFAVLALAFPLLFGFLALALGQDADWDLRNYHYYNAWAALTGRLDRDILAAQTPTFFNPLPDIPFFLASAALPARVVGFLWGAAQGFAGLVLSLTAWFALRLEDSQRRFLAAAAIGLLGACRAGALGQVGTVFNDALLGIGPLVSLLLVMVWWRTLGQAETGIAAALAVLCGLPCGLALGMKLTLAPMAVALCAACLMLPARPGRRLLVVACFGVGVAAGFGLSAGWWMWLMWRKYQNPLFPFFNQVFRSPFALPEAYFAYWRVPSGVEDRLLFPLRFTRDPLLVGEVPFRDLAVPLAYVLVPIALLARLLSRREPADSIVAPSRSRFVITVAALTYVLWMMRFGIYRYLIPLEMLAPLAIVCAVDLLPAPRRLRVGLTAALLAVVAATVEPPDWGRVAWSERAVIVEVPPIERPAETLVLLGGGEPSSFLLPSFPPAMRFVRVGSSMGGPAAPHALAERMRAEIAAHKGPLLTLFYPKDEADMRRLVQAYGLTLAADTCRPVSANLAPGPFALCSLKRAGGPGR